MSGKEKILNRFFSYPTDFSFDEAVALLKLMGFNEVKTGKTSGSRVRFRNDSLGKEFRMHKPHPEKILKRYQLHDIKTLLQECHLMDDEM
ncbi:MAG TPA: type II toxin-antitoxin system HicA family toxin [Porphyromonadaceae bacterium]|mgnify:CR=1 FL=1|jgi:hypothetical protein|uniref:type II toxin-antitoxin system HicA family toxin n=1 Tax=Limibacterium fermenti TaxID=3229863 RepID=UPI000E80E350|nr:type II toxin-antitoxin system HicA family toxin [Porphyromonadaceae bacterium]HBK30730.1 type II toxin-antitoxin system HicA family toxin [Porphyromonadaceae bacterium]HBL32378.1 type II toxin-antitoxin system HicA family toxin [Porphyromonadaceae bacterium]HBX21366.1 type II toxin-antitoxin system HicA family toxin [Porphyromonadaceae bacterium]HBX45107.1 type II toxin-antitoxin system HicA family toxin [Porphyromonadaceae bacterium]